MVSILPFLRLYFPASSLPPTTKIFFPAKCTRLHRILSGSGSLVSAHAHQPRVAKHTWQHPPLPHKSRSQNQIPLEKTLITTQSVSVPHFSKCSFKLLWSFKAQTTNKQLPRLFWFHWIIAQIHRIKT